MKYARLPPTTIKALTLLDGDILIVRTNGSLDLVGRSAVVRGLPEPSVYASYLIRLRFDDSRVTPDFAQIGLRHLRKSGALVDLARTTSGQYNVSLGRLRNASLPIPALAVQRRIVTEQKALQAKVDAASALQQETAFELDSMLSAILDKAFKGELV
jgi:type I restriction enzyme S subunit